MTMSEATPVHSNSISWFQIFKYGVYGLLIVNAFLFFQEDFLASAHLFSDGLSIGQLIEAYAATIDTTSWIVLLLVFELETRVIDDDKLKGSTKWLLTSFKLLCYAVITYAVYGYLNKYMVMHSFEASTVVDLCHQASQSLSYMTDLDEYTLVSAANCADLSGAASYVALPGTAIVTDQEAMASAQWLALIDVVNAVDWLLVVLILGADVWMQMKGRLTDRMIKLNAAIKSVLYLVLLVCAVLWGLDGDFLDFWDAFLWIIAFVFIEMNLFEWHSEVQEQEIQEQT